MLEESPVEHTTCRVCQGQLQPLLDLGEQYPSDFPEEGASPPHPKVPLRLTLCLECRHVQLSHTTPPEWLYRHYWFRSGISEVNVRALHDVVSRAAQLCPVRAGDWAVDIGANDGTLLGFYPPGVVKCAYEPATNLIPALRAAIGSGVVVNDYFPPATGSTIRDGAAKIVTSIAMFYDLEDPITFVGEVARILHPEGVWVIQMAYLPAMLRQTDFSNICHEHISYYSLYALEFLLYRHNLEVVDVEENDVNGGSFRCYVSRPGRLKGFSGAAGRLERMRRAEDRLRLDTETPYQEFAKQVERVRLEIRKVMLQAILSDWIVDLYGASTKGNTMLQYWGLDNRLVRWAIDRSPDKWGRCTIGTNIPIVSEEVGRLDPAHLWICLPWFFKDAFVAREAAYLAGGGKMLFPLPWPEVVSRGVR